MDLTFKRELPDPDGNVRFTYRLRGRGEEIFWFLIPEAYAPGTPSNLDGAAIVALFVAMSQGEHLRVRGPLTALALDNLHELQNVWTLWRPERYRRISISADEQAPVEVTRPEAISCFSGGVDGTFTAWQHSRVDAPRSYALRGALMMQGFDIPLNRSEEFCRAATRARTTLADIGLDLVTMSTNVRGLDLNWEDTFGAQMAACLHQFSADRGVGIIGSGEPYDSLVLPWGSTPVSDHLFSGAGFRVVHHGAGYSRTEKLRQIADWDLGVRNLRVCWEGDRYDTNCGRCEKCVRTALNFRAIDVIPHCFDTVPDERAVRHIKLRSRPQVTELESLLAEAGPKRRGQNWAKEVRRRLMIHRIAAIFRGPLTFLERGKRFVRQRLLRLIGRDESQRMKAPLPSGNEIVSPRNEVTRHV